MAELRPYPLSALLSRAIRELDTESAIFDLPTSKFFGGDAHRDLSVRFHGHRAGSALGPAAGPHTQMAQNIVLSWLSGCRIFELKTVQILDQLKIPRPCIDMETVGYNVEWSQELKLEESLTEYVKAAMMIAILQESGRVPVMEHYRDLVFDMSVGYDLKGIKSERVQAFIDGMLDARPVIDRLRREIPKELSPYRDLAFPGQISNTLTLSTFHGCPPSEIESIIDFLLEEKRLHCIVKLNPTLLGEARVHELLGEAMGYHELRVPSSAFAKDATWEQAVDFVGRLGDKAQALGLGFGVKFSNTLIVENHRRFFPATEKEMYLSGPPLHVLAMNLVARFRGVFGSRYPVSFSAGIDLKNFASAVALGLVPVTTCSDLLKPGGYSRAGKYLMELSRRMEACGATHIPDYIIRAYGQGEAALYRTGMDEAQKTACLEALASGSELAPAAGEHYAAWVAEATLRNTVHYVAQATDDPRYRKSANAKPPRKLDTHLALFDCVTCHKCVPVCPNDANFVYELAPLDVPIVKAAKVGDTWQTREDGRLTVTRTEQFGNFADFCNDCGNCDVFCPELGGPYQVKGRFFGTLADWQALAHLDGFCFVVDPDGAGDTTYARIDGRELCLTLRNEHARLEGSGFVISFDTRDVLATLSGTASVEVDLGLYYIAKWMRDAVLHGRRPSYVNALASASMGDAGRP